MKTFIYLLLLCAITICSADAQIIDPKKKAKRAAEGRTNRRVDQGINKGFDKVEEGIESIFKKKKKKKGADGNTDDDQDSEGSGNATGNGSQAGSSPGQSVSFLDFVPGSNVIFTDNFQQDAMMDFPAKWNSTGAGKVVTIDGVPGRWLELANDTYVNPMLDKPLPENCTIEFDLYLKANGQGRVPNMYFGFTEVRDIVKQNIYYKEKFYTRISLYNKPQAKLLEYGVKFPPIGNKNEFPLTKYNNKILRVSIAANKERVRVYLDKTKIVDLPKLLTDKLRNNFYFQSAVTYPAPEVSMYIGNIRIASSDMDARSLLVKQLMDEGRAVTNDILFDVNSDVIKPESYSIIKQFGEALVSNPGLRIRITGHTDSDGSDAANNTLSQKRAAAVKSYITENFEVTASRIQTDGKGESMPVADNKTTEGKAKNRRVEFVKL